MAAKFVPQATHADTTFQKDIKKVAVADANHDLDDAFRKIFMTLGRKRIGGPAAVEDTDTGAPLGTGWDVVKLVLGGAGSIPADWKPTGAALTKETAGLKTITGFTYRVKVIAAKEGTHPEDLYDFISADNETLYLVLDATTGVWNEVLKRSKTAGKPDKARKIVYIVNRECISDPAGKFSETNDKDYLGAQTERAVKSYVAVEDPDSKYNELPIIYDSWDSPGRSTSNTPYLYDFGSKYSLILAPIVYGANKSTMLTFKGKDVDETFRIETSAAGKKTNSKESMKKVLEKLYTFFTGKGAKNLNGNDSTYEIKLLQKRSGDTLQDLSKFDTSREYKTSDPGKTKFTLQGNNNLAVLTHDTFNTLPVGLLNGNDVVYLGGGGTNPQYIYYFTREDNPKEDYVLKFFEWFTTGGNAKTVLDTIEGQRSSYKSKYIGLVADLKTKIEAEIDRVKSLDPKVALTTKAQGLAEATTINTNMAAIFKACYKACLYRNMLYIPYTKDELASMAAGIKVEDRKKIAILKDLYYNQLSKDSLYSSEQFETGFSKNSIQKEIDSLEIIEFRSYAKRIRERFTLSTIKKAERFSIGMIPEVVEGFKYIAQTNREMVPLFKVIQEKLKASDVQEIKDAISSEFTKTWEFFFQLTVNLAPPTDERLNSAGLLNDIKENITGMNVELIGKNADGLIPGANTSGYAAPLALVLEKRADAALDAVINTELQAEGLANLSMEGGRYERKKNRGSLVRLPTPPPTSKKLVVAMPKATATEKMFYETAAFLLVNTFNYMGYYGKDVADEDLDNLAQAVPFIAPLLMACIEESKKNITVLILKLKKLLEFNGRCEEFVDAHKAAFSKADPTAIYHVPKLLCVLLEETFGHKSLSKFEKVKRTPSLDLKAGELHVHSWKSTWAALEKSIDRHIQDLEAVEYIPVFRSQKPFSLTRKRSSAKSASSAKSKGRNSSKHRFSKRRSAKPVSVGRIRSI